LGLGPCLQHPSWADSVWLIRAAPFVSRDEERAKADANCVARGGHATVQATYRFPRRRRTSPRRFRPPLNPPLQPYPPPPGSMHSSLLSAPSSASAASSSSLPPAGACPRRASWDPRLAPGTPASNQPPLSLRARAAMQPATPQGSVTLSEIIAIPCAQV
jgi:hypothetical protein